MRSNLSSLKSLASQMSTTQTRLSTGTKVNSAIDNANSYYQSRALTNRSSDLDMLLDAMGQSIQTIQAAVKGLEASGEVLEQAAVIAQNAYEAEPIVPKQWFIDHGAAAVVSTWNELKNALNSGVQGDIVIYGNINCEDSIILRQGQNLVGIGAYGIEEPDLDKFSQLSFDLDTINKQSAITINAANLKLSDLSIKVKARSTGISCAVSSGSNTQLHNFDILMDISAAGSNMAFGLHAVKSEVTGKNSIVGIGTSNNYFRGCYACTMELNGQLDIFSNNNQSSGMYSTTLSTNDDAVLNINVRERGLESCVASFNDNSKINISSNLYGIIYGTYNINDKSELNLRASNGAFYSNNPLTVNLNSAEAKVVSNAPYLFLTRNQTDGRFSFTAIEGSRITNNGKVYQANEDIDYIFPSNYYSATAYPMQEVVGEQGESATNLSWMATRNAGRSIDYNRDEPEELSNLVEVDELLSRYNTIITSYDTMVSDSSYQGINLLASGKMDVMFNENRTHSYTVQGNDMSSGGIGITTREWVTKDDIAASIKEIKNAMNNIRDEVTRLGNSLSIIQTSMYFTDAMCDILQTGADDLVLADMNEESANYLALQTRNSLAVNALALAAQSNNSVLKLF